MEGFERRGKGQGFRNLGIMLKRVEKGVWMVLLGFGGITLLFWDVFAGGTAVQLFLLKAGVLPKTVSSLIGFGLSAASSAVQIVVANRIRKGEKVTGEFFLYIIAGGVCIVDVLLDLIGASYIFGGIDPLAFRFEILMEAPVAIRIVVVFATGLALVQEYVSEFIIRNLTQDWGGEDE